MIHSYASPSAQPTDAQLLRAVAAGREPAFITLFDRYKQWAADLALRFTGRPDHAWQVALEAFAYLLRSGPTLEPDQRLTVFLYQAVKNLSRAKRGSAALLADPTPGTALSPIEQAVRQLPERHQEVLLMRFVDGLTLEEISLTLEIPPGTVQSRLHNAILALRTEPATRSSFDQL